MQLKNTKALQVDFVFKQQQVAGESFELSSATTLCKATGGSLSHQLIAPEEDVPTSTKTRIRLTLPLSMKEILMSKDLPAVVFPKLKESPASSILNSDSSVSFDGSSSPLPQLLHEREEAPPTSKDLADQIRKDQIHNEEDRPRISSELAKSAGSGSSNFDDLGEIGDEEFENFIAPKRM